jgi:hypothetical protein
LSLRDPIAQLHDRSRECVVCTPCDRPIVVPHTKFTPDPIAKTCVPIGIGTSMAWR